MQRGCGLSVKPLDRAPPKVNTCRACGYEYPHKQTCPAKGKTCNLCKKPNPFSRCCRLRETNVREVQLQSDYNYRVRVKSVNNKKTPKTLISINNKSVKVTKDTRSSVNISGENAYTFLGKPTLKRKHLPKLLPYGGGSHLKVKGCCEITVEKHGTIVVDKFYLVKGNYGTLLGFQTASDLGVVKITQNVSTSRGNN